MDVKSLSAGVLIGFIVTATLISHTSQGRAIVNTMENNTSSLNIQNLASELEETVSTASIQSISLNPEEYNGQNVTLTGDPVVVIDAPVDYALEDESGYSVLFDCSEYLSNYNPGDYTITGEVQKVTISADSYYESGTNTYTIFECTEPPVKSEY